MATYPPIRQSPFCGRMPWVVWGGPGALLLLPLVAMQFTTEVDWTGADFAVMGAMLATVCLAFELAVRVARTHAYVVAAGVAVVTGFLLTWINLAVGIIGNENNPANQIFFGVLLVALLGAVLSRLDPLRLARAMEVTTVAQLAAAVVTYFLAQAHVWVLTAVFAAMWLLSAQLFRKAAREQACLTDNRPGLP